MKSVCVFCGSSVGTRPAYAATARALGEQLAAQGLRLVYGGSSIGLMRVVADAALAHGGDVVGVIPQALVDFELAYTALPTLHVVANMHERKALMAELADGFIALPGGLGTLEELFEVWTWGQLGLHAKPYGLLDVDGYYSTLVGFLDHAQQEGFMRAPHRGMLLHETEPAALLDAMRRYQPPVVRPKIERRDT
ncbi:MAG: hypothetical protein RL026_1651 [Pseudomonadota bacterium]|jgi:uncharacterized protein (TIGR00730 family)